MNIISEITPEQEAQIPAYAEKWKAKALLTTPIFCPGFEQGVKDLHEEIGLYAPSEFFHYSSPTAMWRDFETWKPKITRVLATYWCYQIPLCDPDSMHRNSSPGSHRAAFNFAAKRYSHGAAYALCETQDSNETWGTVIEKELHAILWEFFLPYFYFPTAWWMIEEYAIDTEEPYFDYLIKMAHKDGPTGGVSITDQCLLAPESWLLCELACVDFCHNVLGIPRNERLYSGLEAIVEHGSLCFVFGQVCVACERPAQVSVHDDGYTITFQDGSVITHPAHDHL